MPDMQPSILSPKNDFVFKRIFGDSTNIAPLSAFLQAALGLPAEEFAGLAVVDPNLNPDHGGGKHCILDVRITTRSGREVDVEIQVERTEELCDRIQYYTARMVAGKVQSGEEYLGMAQSVSIVILDYREWEDGRYHHRFRLYDPEAGLPYPNSMEIHMLELPKRPVDSDGTGLWDWLTFLSSKTREEFDSLAGKGSAMAEAVARLKELSADERERLQAEARDKWLWDQAARKRQYMREAAENQAKAVAEGRAEGLMKGHLKGRADTQAEIACKMLRAGMSRDEVAEITGLSKTAVERLAVMEKQ
jgi:predicted transposase/invertase (TIGR01784 family)